MVNVANASALDMALADLRADRDWAEGAIEGLADFVRSADDRDLFRVNPLRYAETHSMDEANAIDLYLYATRAGLFEMEWAIVCASCGNTYKTFRDLEKVDPHFTCNLCNMDNTATLDEYIQVTFTVSPTIREIVFHHPEKLAIEDRIFAYQYSAETGALYGGLTPSQALESWTVELRELEPGTTVQIEAEMDGQLLVLKDLGSGSELAWIQSLDEPRNDHQFEVEVTENGLVDNASEYRPMELAFRMGRWRWSRTLAIGPGKLAVSCANSTDMAVPIWAIRYPSAEGFEPSRVGFESFLSARRLLNTQTFLKLFRSQVPPEGEQLSVSDLTYLFTDLVDSTAMYDDIGDATAYNVVRLHFNLLGRAVTRNNGAIVKTIGDAVMATFLEPRDAVSAALAMFEALGEFNQRRSSKLGLKVGIHRGHSIAVTLNNALDYFGQNVNIASRTEGLAGPGEILITDEVMSAEGVAQLVKGLPIEPVRGDMKGVAETIGVSRVRVPASR